MLPEKMLKKLVRGLSSHMEATAASKRARTTRLGDVGELHVSTGAKDDSHTDT